MKLLFVVNPISGGVDKEPFLKSAKRLCDKYGIAYAIFKTTGKDDKENLELLLQKYQPDKLVSVGGDGTTLSTALSIIHSDYPMGIIPLGSANGMAVELGVNSKPLEALKDIIMSERIKGLDLIKVNNTHYSIHIGDVGINAQIVESYEKDPNRGMITYAKYFIEQLATLQPFPVKIKANGAYHTYDTYMVAICNARKYGTGVPLNTESNPMDGQFELVLVNQINTNALVKAGLAALDDRFLDSQINKVIATQEAEISFDKPLTLQLDGEVIGKFDHLKIEIIPSAVKLITTTDNTYLNS